MAAALSSPADARPHAIARHPAGSGIAVVETPRRSPPEPAPALVLDLDLAKADRVDGRGERNLVAFTFDDGPNPITTPAVIDALEKYDIPATFFIVSRFLVGPLREKNREILQREVTAGFTVASHSWSHHNLRRAGTPLKLQIDAAVRVLASLSGRPIGMFRAPYGMIGRRARNWLKMRGLTEVRWSVDTHDYLARNPRLLRRQILRMILRRRGGVVLMHDAKPMTARVAAAVFDDLEAWNCRALAHKRAPILPVSIHYFLHDHMRPRAIPDSVQKQTAAYRAMLPARCAKRTRWLLAPDHTRRWNSGKKAAPASAPGNHPERPSCSFASSRSSQPSSQSRCSRHRLAPTRNRSSHRRPRVP